MPGEKCCFCPKPKMIISHPSPCEPLVIPNGCTKGGICPPCQGRYSLARKYTNDICIDDPSCVGMTGFGLPQFATVCSQFADVRSRCPLSCGDCYSDDIDCHGALINDVMCSAFAHIRLKCARTCAAGPIIKIPGPIVTKIIPGKVPVAVANPIAPAGPPPVVIGPKVTPRKVPVVVPNPVAPAGPPPVVNVPKVIPGKVPVALPNPVAPAGPPPVVIA